MKIPYIIELANTFPTRLLAGSEVVCYLTSISGEIKLEFHIYFSSQAVGAYCRALGRFAVANNTPHT
jgi:hypothetical protein